jgi:hypothetical protein
MGYLKFFHLPLVTETVWQRHAFHPQCQQVPSGSEKPVDEVSWYSNWQHKNKTENDVLHDVIYKLYHNVLYFQNIIVFHSTRVNVISFKPLRKVWPFLCRLTWIRSAQQQGCTNFPKFLAPPWNARHQKGHIKQVPSWRFPNINHHHTKSVAIVTWHQPLVNLCWMALYADFLYETSSHWE